MLYIVTTFVYFRYMGLDLFIVTTSTVCNVYMRSDLRNNYHMFTSKHAMAMYTI